jgi:tetratricopeptide (TPR) repeat protein
MAVRAALVLDEQAEVLRLQKERLRKEGRTLDEEQRLRLSHLRHRRFGDYAKAMMEVAVALLIVALLTGTGILIWRASEAHGLVVEPLRTPSDFAARGLDGTMLAQRLLDKLNADVDEVNTTALPPQASASGSWGSDSKVMIPSTGVSLDELERTLRRWLGHETHMSGEVWRTQNGIALSVRVGGAAGATFSGPENNLDKMLDKAALEMLSETQPIAWTDLTGRGDPKGAMDRLTKLAKTSPSSVERAWALAHLAGFTFNNRLREAVSFASQAAALDPTNIEAVGGHAVFASDLGHAEESLIGCRQFFRLVDAGSTGDLSPLSYASVRDFAKNSCALDRGAFADAASAMQDLQEYNIYNSDIRAPFGAAEAFAREHDGAAARAALASRPQYSDRSMLFVAFKYQLPYFDLLKEAEDWSGAASDLGAVDKAALARGPAAPSDFRHTLIWPWLAYSWARLGNFKAANELVALTPLDCDLCLRMRGTVRDLSGDPVGASRWFARAVNDAPSSPFPYFDWGTMLLHRGDYDGAIAKFGQAHERGPHFADPLENWGEALIAENRSDLALAKFEEAAHYAPNWGRLHLKWGEALLWLGRKDEARRQFEIASGLDLAPPDHTQLKADRRRV